MSISSELTPSEPSYMEMERPSIDDVMEDEVSQNMSNESDLEDYKDTSLDDVIDKLVEINLKDFEGALFDDAFDDLYYSQNIEWPNNAYCEFMKIVNKYQLSNSADDAFINFFNKFANLDTSPLLPSTKTEKEFLDESTLPYMMFKEIPIKKFENVEYIFYYRLLIKAIKFLIIIDSIN